MPQQPDGLYVGDPLECDRCCAPATRSIVQIDRGYAYTDFSTRCEACSSDLPVWEGRFTPTEEG